jgi:hypothetical protein
MTYESPEIYDVGSLTGLTAGSLPVGLSKSGSKSDVLTTVIEELLGADVGGSIKLT